MTTGTFDTTVNDTIMQRATLDDVTGLQNITISDNQSAFDSPDFSTILNVVTTNAGFGGFPSMTTAQMNAIANPKLGLVVHNTDVDKVFIYTDAYGWFSISGLTLPPTTTPNGIITWGSGTGNIINDTPVTVDSNGNIVTPASITASELMLNINGNNSTVPGFTVTGSAATAGNNVFNGTAGTVISTTAVNTNSIISVTRNVGVNAPIDVTTIGSLIVGSIINGSSFTVYSTVANDSGNFNWLIINP